MRDGLATGDLMIWFGDWRFFHFLMIWFGDWRFFQVERFFPVGCGDLIFQQLIPTFVFLHEHGISHKAQAGTIIVSPVFKNRTPEQIFGVVVERSRNRELRSSTGCEQHTVVREKKYMPGLACCQDLCQKSRRPREPEQMGANSPAEGAHAASPDAEDFADIVEAKGPLLPPFFLNFVVKNAKDVVRNKVKEKVPYGAFGFGQMMAANAAANAAGDEKVRISIFEIPQQRCGVRRCTR